MQFKLISPYSLTVAGALTVLGFAPFYWFFVPILTLALVFFAAKNAHSAQQAFAHTFGFALGLHGAGTYWIYICLHTFGGMPWWFAGFCTFCLCAFMALFPAVAIWLAKKIDLQRTNTLWLTFPLFWALSDWVRSWIFTGFPWLTLGYSQVPYSPLTGFLPIIGVYGVSFLLVLLATLCVLILRKDTLLIHKRNAIALSLMLIVGGALLRLAPWVEPVGKPLNVALVQGNVAQSEKWSPALLNQTIAQYLQMARENPAELIVLPETALPIFSSQLDPKIAQDLTVLGKQSLGNIITGLVGHDENSGAIYNTAMSFGADKTQVYHKNHLVPFGEFIPLKQWLVWIYRDFLHMPLSGLSRGGVQSPMQLGRQQVGVNICYEDVFGEEIIRQLPAATILVNLTNDAWYGRSIAADQHLQFSQARAIETGRMVLRATNTGATAAIDTQGFILAYVPQFRQTVLKVQAQGYNGATPYVRWGNGLFLLISLLAIAFVLSRKNK